MEQSSPTWFEMVLGPYGALFLACAGLWVFWCQLKDITKSFNKAQDETMTLVRGMITNVQSELKYCQETKLRQWDHIKFLEDRILTKLGGSTDGQHSHPN